MSDVITLSSDEENTSPPKKARKIESRQTVFRKSVDFLKDVSVSEVSHPRKKELRYIKPKCLPIELETNLPKLHSNEVIILGDCPDFNSNEKTCNDEASKTDDNAPKAGPSLINLTKDISSVNNNESDTKDSDDSTDFLVLKSVEVLPPTYLQEFPSTSKTSEITGLFGVFFQTCRESILGSRYESRLLPKFEEIRRNFNSCESAHSDKPFKKMLEEQTTASKTSAASAVVSFQKIYSYLSDLIKRASVDIPIEKVSTVNKLIKTYKLLLKKIKKLEEAEVDFDAEENSTYIMLDRYSQRLTKVYNKYCEIVKLNPHKGRLLYEKLRFTASNYAEINKAISNSYKHNKFPNYKDIEKCVRRCSQKHNLSLSESDILSESKHCFVKLGNSIQQRRKLELYDVQSEISSSEDPALADSELDEKLKQSAKERENKIAEIVEQYCRLQDNNIEVEVSEASEQTDSDTE